METSKFEGAVINGKQFPFARVTISRQQAVIKWFRPSIFTRFFDRFFPIRENARMWKKTRAVAFVKDWKWKYFGIIPKELRCSQISLKQAGEIQADFFAIVVEMVKGHDEPLFSVINSEIAKGQTKSGS